MIDLINPFNGKPLELYDNVYKDEDGNSFPVINNIPRFVTHDNYAKSFGFQWNKFAQIQLDREAANLLYSKKRFFAETGWDKEDLTGKTVLEVGSGAGRFSKVVLDYTKAELYSVDYSNAVEANYKNNGHYGKRFHLYQASIYELPFAPASFDKVFCFGVLQHTPDVKKSVKCLVDMVKPGGELVVDFYPIRGWWTKVHIKYMLRPFTKKMSHEKLLSIIEKNINWMIKITMLFNKIGIGRFVNRFIPICDINGTLPSGLSKKELREWCILDTFDMFSPVYDQPQKIKTVKKWMEEFGIKVSFADFITFENNKKVAVARGVK